MDNTKLWKKHAFKLAVSASAAVIALGSLWILNRPESGAARQATDDAYVRADFTAIAPQISGAVARVAVADHQRVRAGELLVQIDDRDLRIGVQDAQAKLASASATVTALRAQIGRQQNLISQTKAAISADDASLKLAERNQERFTNLAEDGSGTLQAQQQAEAQVQIQRAARERDIAAHAASAQQQLIITAELEKAKAEVAAATAKVADAELKLSYARIVAPTDGVVDRRSARVGGYVRTGEALLTLVPLQALYIEANFRETQLAYMTPGQPVVVTVDALPNLVLRGHVDSLAPASGVSFSPVPPHNATGNFTKIVQRLPVRIALTPGQPGVDRLRVGMSVRTKIETHSQNGSALAAAPAMTSR